jgi:hypothetical protein
MGSENTNYAGSKEDNFRRSLCEVGAQVLVADKAQDIIAEVIGIHLVTEVFTFVMGVLAAF